MSAFENLRAYDSNRIKAYNVWRGKADLVKDGYWPGGPIPFGYCLKVAKVEIRHNREIKHHVLVFEKVTGPVVRMLYEKSAEKPSWGQYRLTHWLDQHEEIPQWLKPFNASTVGKWLRSPIYRGIFLWNRCSQGVIDDRRVIEKNDEDNIMRVEGFCDPIAIKEVIDKVDANLLLRGKFNPQDNGVGETLPQRGVVYEYPLTGLVRCGHCGASMTPNSTAPYTTKSGEVRNYCSYLCPNSRTDACDNGKRIKEEWLREVVIGKVKERLMPDEESVSELVEEARNLVEEQRQRSEENPEAVLASLTAELEELDEQIRGWAESLSKKDLHRRLRDDLETKSSPAYDRIDEIEQVLQERDSEESVLNSAVRYADVSSRLDRLHLVLMAECPTATNLELSMHIDRIDCFEDGKVVSRICKMGSTPRAVQWFADPDDLKTEGESDSDRYRVKPRRRGLLRLHSENDNGDELLDRIHMATDPARFAGLPDHWFWIDEYQMPEKASWVHENAHRVLARYEEIKATGKKPSMNGMAKEFGKSRPTIARGMDIASGVDDGTKPEHRREPKRIKGDPDMEAAIEQMHDDRRLNKEIAERLGLSRSAVTNALDRLYEKRGQPRPDGRRTRHQ